MATTLAQPPFALHALHSDPSHDSHSHEAVRNRASSHQPPDLTMDQPGQGQGQGQEQGQEQEQEQEQEQGQERQVLQPTRPTQPTPGQQYITPLPPPSPAAAFAQTPVMDSDMENAEDTAGGVSPFHWPNSTHDMAASVIVVDERDSFEPPPPPPVAPLSPVPPPPPPPAMAHLDHPGLSMQPPPPPPIHLARTAAEDSDDEDDDDRSHVSYDRARNFYPFTEDLSQPDPEELRQMQAMTEYTAADDAHWQRRTFFDPQDPEFVPGDQGKIEWLVKDFNGTSEKPRTELLLTSDTVNIGGFEWRIKLLPHGNMHTDRLSLYVENVTVQHSDLEDWPEDKLPLPVIGDHKVKKRNAVAAQMSLLVYNPDEPRVNEFRSDAHQFHHASSDHGWTRFTGAPWYEIHRRSYAQRQPLLRNDTLAVKAFIRVIHDPTGCMWAAKESKQLRKSPSMTGLLPFPEFDDLALGPVLSLWLHLRPFRQVLYELGSVDMLDYKEEDLEEGNILPVLQAVLYNMRSRLACQTNDLVGMIADYIQDMFNGHEPQDVIETMDSVLANMHKRLQWLSDKHHVEKAQVTIERLKKVFGDPSTQFSGSRQTRLSIQGVSSMQELVKQLPSSLCDTEVLTVELERQVFDNEKRCWKKLLNKVHLDDHVSVGGVSYTLYGFATHEGHLRNGRYASYFRPGGVRGLWYTYKHKSASCQTKNKAVLSKEGVSPPEAIEEPVVTQDRPMNYGRLAGQAEAVAYVVVYLRDDVAQSAFDLSTKEPWDVPQWVLDDYNPRTSTPQALASASAEMMAGQEDVAPGTGNEDFEMNDAATEKSNEDKMLNDQNDDSVKSVVINYLSQPFYKGQFKDGAYHGEGHLIYLNGDSYNGTFSHGLRSGQGTMHYQNNDTYTGSWCEDQHHGQGTYTESRTGNVYTGNWEEGKKQGQGTTYWKMSDEESRMCRICYSGEADAAFYECGHVVACHVCAKRVDDCPVCRRKVRDVVRLFYLA